MRHRILAQKPRSSVVLVIPTLLTLLFLSLTQVVTHAPVPEYGVPFSGLSRASTITQTLYLPIVMSVQSGALEWTQLAGNPQRTAFVHVDLPKPWHVRWIWNGPSRGVDGGPAPGHLRLPRAVQPITGDQKVYVGHFDGVVRAISEITGDLVWSTYIGGQIVNTAAYDPIARSLYVGSTNGRLYRLDASDGALRGSFDAGGEIHMAPLLVDDTIYIGSTNGMFYALDKFTLRQKWVYSADGALYGSPAYSSRYGGLVIILVEGDPRPSVHALQASNGTRRWVQNHVLGFDRDDFGSNLAFLDTYPVVSEVHNLVIVRTYRSVERQFTGEGYSNTAPSTPAEIRRFIARNRDFQSFYVLDLGTGAERYVAPVAVGGIGDGIWSIGPQAVIKRLNNGDEIAYVLWRTRQACAWMGFPPCDSRDDTTLGEMDLATGNIRFVQDWRNQGTMRIHTDEQSPLSMAGDMILHAHWMTLGILRITDRAASYGNSYSNPIPTEEVYPVTNSMLVDTCPARRNHFCPESMRLPAGEPEQDPGFYIYYTDQMQYDLWWHSSTGDPRNPDLPSASPVRSAAISNRTIYWKTVDGAIIALGP
ncbi:MAG: PQQ-binding-like beta-propeller repeat protein [Anaerolineae bacterium]|nr:PQQ-binding-like beta-propeller repeat protein [Anaerolineae bacterium]